MLDGEKPCCRRCFNSGFQCAGYESQRVFIDEGARFRDHEASSGSPAVPKQDLSSDGFASPTQRKPLNRQLQVHHRVHHRRVHHLPLQDDFVFLTYFLSRFPERTAATQPGPLDVLPRVFTMGTSPPQQSAVQALATIYFGKTRYDRRVYDKGMRLYSNAIVNLCEALKTPGKAVEIDTMVGALCLCLFENIVLSEPIAWLRHYKGVSDLVGALNSSSWLGELMARAS